MDSSWIRTFRVNGTEIPVKLDSGAQGNVMSVNVFNTLQHKPMVKPTKTSLIGFGGNKITPRGIVSLNLEFKEKKHSVEFFVIQQTAQTLLGLTYVPTAGCFALYRPRLKCQLRTS